MGEIRRVLLNRKMLCLFLVLFLLQSAALLYAGRGGVVETGTVSEAVKEYQTQFAKLRGIRETAGQEAASAWLQEQEEGIVYLESPGYPVILANSILKEQMDAIAGYPEYLKQVQENSERMKSSVLYQSDYLQREIAKAAGDYAGLEGTELVLGEELAFRELISEKSFSYSLLLIPVMICILFLEERKKGLWKLLYAAYRYRVSFGMLRAGILTIGSAVMTGGLGIWRVVLCGAIYGGYGELSRSIQSISMCREVVLPISVGTFLCLWIAVHILAVCVWGLLLWVILTSFGALYRSVGLLALIGIAQYFFYVSFPDHSRWRILRYLNLFMLLEPRQYLLHYLNVSLFGRPVQILFVCILWSACFCVLLMAAGILVQNKKLPGKPDHRLHPAEVLKKVTSRMFASQGRFLQEGYKLLITQKGLLILVLLSILQLTAASAPPAAASSEAATQEHFYRKYQGLVTEASLAKMEEELGQIRVMLADTETDRYAVTVLFRQEAVLAVIVEKCRAAIVNGQEIWLFPQYFYRSLLGPDNPENHSRLMSLESVLFLCLLIPVIFSIERESNITRLTKTCYYGRGRRNRLLLHKLIYCFLYTTAVYGWIYGRDVWLALQAYGKPEYLDVAASNLTFLRINLPQIPIRTLLVGVYVLRFLVQLLCAFAMCLIGSCCRSTRQAQLISLLAFGIPGVLYLIGIEVWPLHLLWKCIGMNELFKKICHVIV